MGIQVEWFDDDAKNIVLVTYAPGWTWHDFADAKKRVDALVMSVDVPVYVINDHTNVPLFPTGKRSGMTEISDAFDNAPPNIVMVYTVGAPSLIRIILNTLKRLTMNRLLRDLTLVQTIDDALADIKHKQAEALQKTS